jgi:hypothetical protein
MDCYLALRGLKTLAVRMRAHSENARAIATFLTAHPKVTKVHYPGLVDHPGHEIAARQMSDYGGMVSFEVASKEEAIRVAESTEVFFLAESLGGVESLIEVPADDPRQVADSRSPRHADPPPSASSILTTRRGSDQPSPTREALTVGASPDTDWLRQPPGLCSGETLPERRLPSRRQRMTISPGGLRGKRATAGVRHEADGGGAAELP